MGGVEVEMYSALQRLNAFFFHGVTVLFFCAVACNIHVLYETHVKGAYELTEYSIEPMDKPVKFLPYQIQTGHPIEADVAVLRFNMTVDLRKVWNWNVKMLFVYVTVEYETDDHPLNQVIIWDHIVLEKENAIINKKEALNKYSLFDHGHGL